MSVTLELWIAFGVLMIFMLAVDLGSNRTAHSISVRQAGIWSFVWVALALGFNAAIYFLIGQTKALEFFTGYVIEKSLSVDNLFVFIMIFRYFHIPPKYQARVLKWGIIGAIVLRAVFIFVGIELLSAFHWMFYLFGALLIITAWKMAFGKEEEINPEKNILVKVARKYFPITKRIQGDWFIKRRGKTWMASPLLLALVMVESSDVLFALDSIPAIFAVTLDPFIVFTSNLFAIMGLRALYFLLAGMIDIFVYLKPAICFILAFVGVKMMVAAAGFEIPVQFSLAVILTTLALAVVASLVVSGKRPHKTN